MNKVIAILKRIIGHLIMLSLSLIVTLCILEVFVRVFFPQDDYMGCFSADKKYGYINKRNFYQRYRYPGYEHTVDIRTNSMGLRDREYDLTRTDYKHVLLLGDSFTFGFGQNAENLFDEKLERLLNGSGEKYFVLNAGVGGWGTLQEIRYAKDHFETFRPDIIVITFCGNDPLDDFMYLGMKPYHRWLFYFPWRKILKDHSHLFRFLAKGYYKVRRKWVITQMVTSDRNRSDTLRYIKEFHEDFLKFNPNGVLLVQATDPLDEDTRRWLGTLSNGKNLFYVDLYDEARKYRAEELNLLELAGDSHWSETMHSISAKKLSEKIMQIRRN